MSSNEIKYTRQQLLAMMKDRHLAVTANAGSGKTSVLVEKYLDLLMTSSHKNPVESIRSIIAITFTKQAAADMKAKITRKISERMLGTSLTPQDLKKLKILRENISAAKVSTIHSFCNSLLRDYPIEADISPVFREMDEYESGIASNLAVDSLLEDYSEALLEQDFSTISKEESESFSRLLDLTGIKSLRDMLLSLIKEPVTLKNLSDFYEQEISELTQFYHDELNHHFLNLTQKYYEIFIEQFDNTDPASKNRADAEAVLNEIGELLQAPNPEISSIVEKFTKFRTIKVKGNAIYSNNIFSIKFGKDTSVYASHTKEFDSMLKDYASFNQLQDSSNDYLVLTKMLVSLAVKANDILWEDKNEQAAYTFDDLLVLSAKLLEDSEVRDKIMAGINYLMVDEFQDTNQIQYEIVKNLAPALDNPDIKLSPKLFIVGDAKQSIYGFRSADVSVFNKAKKEITAANSVLMQKGEIHRNAILYGQLIETDEIESLGYISLADTFRLLPAIALFVNEVCSKLFDGRKTGISYEPLICGRKINAELENEQTLSPEFGTIKFLTALKPSSAGSKPSSLEDNEQNIEETVSRDYRSESELVCLYINKIVSGETDIRIFDGTEYVTPQYKDIAILTRKKNNIPTLSAALIESKINFSVVSGKGFYQTQEVMDFVSLLNFLVNRNDDVSIAGVLKSPLFNITDGELLNISLISGNNFYEKFTKYIPADEKSSYFIERAKSIIAVLEDLSARASISELLIKAIEIADYYAAIEKFDAKAQIKSNIRQFIQSAREFESKGYKSLYEFIQRANILMENSGEAEAAFLTGENIVCIMTTHASKGLEFPVVILFDSNFRTTTDKGLIRSKNYGLSVPLKMPVNANDDGKSSLESGQTIPQFIIKEKKSAADSAEEARLLYVAITRAKDHLIISSTLKETKESFSANTKSFLGFIIDSLGIERTQLFDDNFVNISGNLAFTGNGTKNLNLNIEIINTGELQKSVQTVISESSQVQNHYDKIFETGAIETGNRFDIVSATKLMIYSSKFDSFIDRYVLGLPENPNKFKNIYEKNVNYTEIEINADEIEAVNNISVNSEESNLNESNADGSLSGTIIHKVMENINYWLEDLYQNKFEKLSVTVNSALFENFRQNDKYLYVRIFEECKSVALTEVIRSNSQHFKYSEFEKLLNMPLEGSIITGNIDLLLKNNDESRIEVWDWKSNIIKNESDIARLGEHYTVQIQFYLYLVSKLYPQFQSYSGKLLFTRFAGHDNWTYDIKMTKQDLEKFEIELKQNLIKIKGF